MNPAEPIEELLRLLDLSEPQCAKPVALADVERWMATDDDEVKGALIDALDLASFRARIVPSLPEDRRLDFTIDHLCASLCRDDDLDDEYAYGPADAAWELARQFELAWEREGPASASVSMIKLRLERAYQAGPDRARERIRCLTLDRLFARSSEVRRRFKDWADRPDLAEAFAFASL